jgi:hypothetical protein
LPVIKIVPEVDSASVQHCTIYLEMSIGFVVLNIRESTKQTK